jgi:hypothetical protein
LLLAPPPSGRGLGGGDRNQKYKDITLIFDHHPLLEGGGIIFLTTGRKIFTAG